MNRTIAVAPVRKTIRVQASPARAFQVFTQGMSRWWPPSHTILKVEPKDYVLEPRVGGRWYQTGVDGSECDTGKVLVWEPPAKLVLAWQITPEWQYDPNLITEVEVRFTDEGEGVTRVDLEHRNLDRVGEAAEAIRSAVDAPGGWTAILESFRSLASGGN
jgi:uncharacterized protein YndB with AHSA1/START domain